MNPRALLIGAALLLAACSIPFVGGDDEKAECDRIAARAIQTKSAGDARTYAAQATECYARLAQ